MTEEQLLEDLDDELLEEDEDTQKDMYLTFHLAGEDYGIAVAYVTEIIGIQKITTVPDMPPYVKGVINLRGNVIPVIDVRIRFDKPAYPYNTRTSIIVVSMGNTIVGLVVDEMREVATIPAEQIEPPPGISRNKRNPYISGLGKMDSGIKLLLDIKRLLYDGEDVQSKDEKSQD